LLENAALAALAVGDSRQAAEFVARMPASLAQDPQVRILRGAAKIGQGEAPEVPAEATGDADVYIRDGSRLLAPSRLPVESAIAGCERLAGTAGPFQQAARRLLARAQWHADAQDAASQAQRAAEGSKSLSDWRFLDRALKRARMDTAACESTMAGLASCSLEAALEYTGWLLVRHQAGAAEAWLAALPSELAKDNRLADRRALVLLSAGDETGFQAAITGGAWGRISADSADFAFSARLADLRKNAGLRADLWGRTLLACSRDVQCLRVLNRLAMDWGWRDETSSSFRALLAGGAGPAEARRYLAWARQCGDSALIEEAALAARTAIPSDDGVKALWARVVLLREDAAAATEAAAVAAELASRDPAHVPLLALALRHQGRNDEAIAALEKLPPELLMQPRAALYYGFLIASVEPSRAGRYLDYAARGADFLPEEKQMLSQARATTNARGDLSNP
jgi:hypothetical protein